MKRRRPFSRWSRLYEDACHDPKITGLKSHKERWFWVCCLNLACKHDGYIPPEKHILENHFCGHYNWRLHEDVYPMLEVLLAQELLDKFADGRIAPHNWHARQFQTDTSRERMRQFRARKVSKQSPNGQNLDISQAPDPVITSHLPALGDGKVTVPEYRDTDIYIAAAAEIRSRATESAAENPLPPPPPVQNPEPVHTPTVVDVPAPQVSLRSAEVIAACSPVTARLGPLSPGLLRGILDALGSTPASVLADRVVQRGPDARNLGLLIALARDANEQHRSGWSPPPPLRKPVVAINNSVDYPEYRRSW